ncbi:MAG: ABC transporter permease [candidate division KSB1 bacterium]|nr:ABC transporter permease [candidate division KSB1 bacterium]MDZ7334100.1 ABC transporter permease [candidate division KSB1 bacterium]MDZ7356311.1 ABC transporter permease [candidate division KSB1 bacterium]MDZ7401931.1 ABC transporter permease [candidate division KSB1 bacterium]
MKDIGIIFRREFRAYFYSPIAYVFSVIFILLNSGIYMFTFFFYGNADMREFFSALPLTLGLIFIPAISMRLWSEEHKLGTVELLLTLPMKTEHIVLGKFLASFVFYLVALSGTLVIPILLVILGKPDFGPIIGGYFGAILLGAFYLAVGIFISGFFSDQIVSLIITSLSCGFLALIGWQFVPMVIDGWIPGLGEFLYQYVGVTRHFNDIERGVIDLKSIVYFLSFTALFLYLNAKSLERRKF